MLVGIWDSVTILQFKGVNMPIYRGVSLKFNEPPESRPPTDIWRMYIFKGEDVSSKFALI